MCEMTTAGGSTEACRLVSYASGEQQTCTLPKGHESDHVFADGSRQKREPTILIDRMGNKSESWETPPGPPRKGGGA